MPRSGDAEPLLPTSLPPPAALPMDAKSEKAALAAADAASKKAAPLPTRSTARKIRARRVLAGVVAAFALLALFGRAWFHCGRHGKKHHRGGGRHHGHHGDGEGGDPAVADFLARLDAKLTALTTKSSEASWNYETNLTEFNLAKSTKAGLELNAAMLALYQESKDLDASRASPTQRRQLDRLNAGFSTVLADPAEQAELANLIGKMQGIYGSATYNGHPLEPDLTEILASSRDYDELADAYMGWRKVTGPGMRDAFTRYIELSNKAAQQGGYRDMADQWLGGYEMPAPEMQDLVEDLWDQVLPLYQEVHCHVRTKLKTVYGDQHFGDDNLIPAHLLGNMWGQQWGNIADLVLPHPAVPDADLTAALKRQNYTVRRMHQLSDDFYASLGLEKLPATFWDRSMLTKPTDCDAVCHASAWDIDTDRDVRIKMCTDITAEDLQTVHHEQGHLQYDLAYRKQPYLFREGAADFFHEAIGDTIALSVMVPKHLAEIGLVDETDPSPERALNALMRMALEKLAFLPFGYLVDRWRWLVARGDIQPAEYTRTWWDLVQSIQGMKPPVPRDTADADGAFDAGAKFHVAGGVPYLRYFLSHIVEFQFHRGLCRAAGHTGPLHECSISGSAEAGAQFRAMLELGASKPWPEALAAATGGEEFELDASAILQYFQPLIDWLREQNDGKKCAWAPGNEGLARSPKKAREAAVACGEHGRRLHHGKPHHDVPRRHRDGPHHGERPHRDGPHHGESRHGDKPEHGRHRPHHGEPHHHGRPDGEHSGRRHHNGPWGRRPRRDE
ncbi:hypothetical protein H9P43_002910 [Blastocladiella emersonii ATCC 22665]|nr:hypothetical protein H9P43_002910 [Blastocladiella emersonii ATCC 22665]